MQVFLIENKPYLAKELVVNLNITTDRYLRNGKQKPKWWDVQLHPENKKQILIGYEALLDEHKQKVVNEIGNPYELIVREPVLALIKNNPAAYSFFNSYTYNGGERLPFKRIVQYTRAEAILTFINTYTKVSDIRRMFGMNAPAFYTHLTNIVRCEIEAGKKSDYEGYNQLDGKFPYSYVKLIKRAKDYMQSGSFQFLIHPNYGNDFRLKVGKETEELLNNIYVMNHKPNYTQVHKIYTEFLEGKIGLVNEDTAEIYNPAEHKPISASCVYTYVAAWENKVVTHKRRSSDKIGYNDTYRPYASLQNPDYAGSIISMDDRDLPFKTNNGIRVKAYLAMDVASECFIGYSFHNTDKDMGLVLDCFRNMYQYLKVNNYNQPAEVEVEQHLMSTFKDGLLKEGNLFPYVRYAQAANPQEKSIERAFRRMRYGIDKQNEGWIPRPFARDEANQSRTEDDIKVSYTSEEVIELATNNIRIWNNQLHPDQKKNKGLTRLQVWEQKQNANLLPIDWPRLSKYLGVHTVSSVNRGEIRAFNNLYLLPTMQDVSKLDNGKELHCYAMQGADGSIDTMYVYKDDTYILTASKKQKWQKARIERTDADSAAMIAQQSYTAAFDKTVKTKKAALQNLIVVNNKLIQNALDTPVEVIEDVVIMQDQETVNVEDMAIDNL
jgi:hypothetical protein